MILKLGPDNNQLDQLNQGRYAMGWVYILYEMKIEKSKYL